MCFECSWLRFSCRPTNRWWEWRRREQRIVYVITYSRATFNNFFGRDGLLHKPGLKQPQGWRNIHISKPIIPMFWHQIMFLQFSEADYPVRAIAPCRLRTLLCRISPESQSGLITRRLRSRSPRCNGYWNEIPHNTFHQFHLYCASGSAVWRRKLMPNAFSAERF